MSRDVLLYGLSQSEDEAALMVWAQGTPGLHEFVPDFHRLQLEHWIWSNRDGLGHDILDVGVYNRRDWLGSGYVTCGEHGEDVAGDLLKLPFSTASFDGIVLTEVLEHCTNPWAAIHEVFRVLRPGGLLLVTSPFLWPDHRTEDYKDFWRFTEQGWELLLGGFDDVSIVACGMTPEAEMAYDFMRRFECLGFRSQTKTTTAYLCSARKP